MILLIAVLTFFHILAFFLVLKVYEPVDAEMNLQHTAAARLPSFHTCVAANEERLTPKWYKEHGNYIVFHHVIYILFYVVIY